MEEYKYIIVDDLEGVEREEHIRRIVFDTVMSRKQNNEIPSISFSMKQDLKYNKEGFEYLNNQNKNK